jgi:GGDEF domain-containing protein
MKFMYLERHPDVPVTAACGIAVYDSETDDGYDAVFARADELMYQNKIQMKKELAEKAGEK